MAVYSDTEKQNIAFFFDACNEMIAGKFILSDTKITKILKAIATSEALYSTFGSCLTGFNFHEKLDNATNFGNKFTLPDDDKDIIALVFCLLLEVDNKKMNLQTFVSEYFYNADGYNISYSNFALTVLVPFKKSVMFMLGVDEKGENTESETGEITKNADLEENIKEDISPEVKIVLSNLQRLCYELYHIVSADRKMKESEKEDVKLTISAIGDAIKVYNFNIINALLITLELLIGKNKRVNYKYNEMKDLLLNFYFNMRS